MQNFDPSLPTSFNPQNQQQNFPSQPQPPQQNPQFQQNQPAPYTFNSNRIIYEIANQTINNPNLNPTVVNQHFMSNLNGDMNCLMVDIYFLNQYKNLQGINIDLTPYIKKVDLILKEYVKFINNPQNFQNQLNTIFITFSNRLELYNEFPFQDYLIDDSPEEQKKDPDYAGCLELPGFLNLPSVLAILEKYRRECPMFSYEDIILFDYYYALAEFYFNGLPTTMITPEVERLYQSYQGNIYGEFTDYRKYPLLSIYCRIGLRIAKNQRNILTGPLYYLVYKGIMAKLRELMRTNDLMDKNISYAGEMKEGDDKSSMNVYINRYQHIACNYVVNPYEGVSNYQKLYNVFMDDLLGVEDYYILAAQNNVQGINDQKLTECRSKCVNNPQYCFEKVAIYSMALGCNIIDALLNMGSFKEAKSLISEIKYQRPCNSIDLRMLCKFMLSKGIQDESRAKVNYFMAIANSRVIYLNYMTQYNDNSALMYNLRRLYETGNVQGGSLVTALQDIAQTTHANVNLDTFLIRLIQLSYYMNLKTGIVRKSELNELLNTARSSTPGGFNIDSGNDNECLYPSIWNNLFALTGKDSNDTQGLLYTFNMQIINQRIFLPDGDRINDLPDSYYVPFIYASFNSLCTLAKKYYEELKASNKIMLTYAKIEKSPDQSKGYDDKNQRISTILDISKAVQVFVARTASEFIYSYPAIQSILLKILCFKFAILFERAEDETVGENLSMDLAAQMNQMLMLFQHGIGKNLQLEQNQHIPIAGYGHFYRFLGIMYYKHYKYQEAFKCFQNALQYFPEKVTYTNSQNQQVTYTPEDYLERGTILFDMGILKINLMLNNSVPNDQNSANEALQYLNGSIDFYNKSKQDIQTKINALEFKGDNLIEDLLKEDLAKCDEKLGLINRILNACRTGNTNI